MIKGTVQSARKMFPWMVRETNSMLGTEYPVLVTSPAVSAVWAENCTTLGSVYANSMATWRVCRDCGYPFHGSDEQHACLQDEPQGPVSYSYTIADMLEDACSQKITSSLNWNDVVLINLIVRSRECEDSQDLWHISCMPYDDAESPRISQHRSSNAIVLIVFRSGYTLADRIYIR